MMLKTFLTNKPLNIGEPFYDFRSENQNGEKIEKLKLNRNNSPERNLDIRFNLISKINPLNGKASELENNILQILRDVIDDN